MIDERELLLMPNRESIAIFGDSYKVRYFNWRDGDLLLFLASAFSDSEIAAALAVGGKIVTGYAFEYYGFISIKRIGLKGWCACPARGIGFALTREVAEKVSSASYAEFKRDIERCYEERERKWRELGI
jgi:hypothetical protein